MKKRIISIFTMLVAVLWVMLPMTANAASPADFAHDPRLNSKVVQDAKVDINAVYGFSPRSDSTRLGDYAKEDWSNPEKVAAWRAERIAYLKDFDSMYNMWSSMKASGCSTETIARAVSNERNQIRLRSYKDDPEGLATVKKSNLATYGNENGPTAESLYEKYGSWEKVLLKSFSSNSGMDACLGLYDDQYEHYVMTGEPISNSSTVIYTVIEGESLMKIADVFYGNPAEWPTIYEANKDTIKNPSLIHPGDKIKVPLDTSK